MQHWLVKQEPEEYGWVDFARDGTTEWTGVRNYQARIHLRAMKKGDAVLFYESMTTKAVVGIASVSREAFPDPTAEAGEDWTAVELKAGKALPTQVTLATIKETPALKDIALLRQSRLSVMPLTPRDYTTLLRLGGVK